MPLDKYVLLLKKEVLNEGVYEMPNKRISRILQDYAVLAGRCFMIWAAFSAPNLF